MGLVVHVWNTCIWEADMRPCLKIKQQNPKTQIKKTEAEEITSGLMPRPVHFLDLNSHLQAQKKNQGELAEVLKKTVRRQAWTTLAKPRQETVPGICTE